MQARNSRVNLLSRLIEVLLAAALIPALLAPPLHLVLFRAQAYRQAVQAQQLDQRLASILADWLTRPAGGSGLDESLAYINRAQLERELAALLPEAWAQEQAFGLVDNLVAGINLQVDRLSLPLDMRAFKLAVQANDQQLAETIVTSWPACSAEDVLELGRMALSGELEHIPYCQPPELLRPLVIVFARGLLNLSVAPLPDTLDLAVLVPARMPQGMLLGYRAFRALLAAAPIAVLILTLAAVAASWHRVWAAAGLIGRSLIIASVLLTLLLVLAFLLGWLILPELPFGAAGVFPEGLRRLLADTAKLVALRYGLSQAVWLGLAFLSGLLLVILQPGEEGETA